MENKIKLASNIVGLISAAGAGNVIGNAIRFTTPAGQGKVISVITKVGAIFISNMVAKSVASHAEKEFVSLAETVVSAVESASEK